MAVSTRILVKYRTERTAMFISAMLSYTRYLVRHTTFVRQECWKRGLFMQGLLHDLSKWRPDEFIPYALHFYGESHDHETTKYWNKIFYLAWLKHKNRNPHHWQWWVLPKDDGSVIQLEMPHRYRLEMICDWI